MEIKAPVFSAYQKSQNTISTTDKTNNNGFNQMVDNSINNTINSINNVEAAGNASLVNNMSLEDLSMAVNEAEMTLKSVVAIRDKIIGAYQDIIKMPI